MSRTFLELTLAISVAVLAFAWALQVVPLVIERVLRYFNRTLGGDQKEQTNDADKFQDDHSWPKS